MTIYSSSRIYTPDGNLVENRFPPVLDECPPYWSKLSSGECKKDFDNGNSSCDTRDIDPNLIYTEKNPVVDLSKLNWVQRCKWAKKCNVKYDFNNKPCTYDSFSAYTNN